MMKSTLFFLVIILMTSPLLKSQEIYKVNKGERPPIDYERIAPEAYEKGLLMIKFTQDQTLFLETHSPVKSKSGIITFGIGRVDALNEKHGAMEVTQHFLSPAFGNSFTDRHKAWGFHLWYMLEFDESIDVSQLITEYGELTEIEVAEPVFKKQHFGYSSSIEFLPVIEELAEANSTNWTPNDPMLNTQWHYNNTGQQSGTPGADISLFDAWDLERGHSSVIVAIIDDGIQFNHPDLTANMWQNAQGHYGYNFVSNSSTISPGNHGTHVAGTVAAVNNNNTGLAGVAGGSGTGDGVRLMSCQVFTSSSSGGFHLAPVWAADNGAAISQNSWGYTSAGYYDQNVLDAIDYFNTYGGGGVLDGGITIFAAGNSDAAGQWYPGYYSGAFSVAATNNQDQKAWYSNFDTWVDISAPGGETWGNNSDARGVRSTITGSSYAYYEGTSMACPHASGVAALIISYAFRNGVMLTATDIADVLRNTTDNHYTVNPGFANQLGTGRLNAHQALLETQALLSGVFNPQNFSAQTVSTSQINLNWQLNNNNNAVMLVYSMNGTFGTPASGTSYSVGNTIPGGGTVIYKGSATNFNHTGLQPATLYYYRVYSYDSSNDYSSGRNAQATTLCDVISTLPLSEDFNAGNEIPICWEIADNQGNGQVWQFGTHSSGLQGTTGNYAFLNSDAYGSGNTQNADLISPLLDLTNYSNVSLAFTHYFRQYQTTSTASLYYSVNNGVTWTQIQQWNATTTNPAAFNQVIAAVDGQSQVRFRWNYTGTWGYYWDVDDVIITGTQAQTPILSASPSTLNFGYVENNTISSSQNYVLSGVNLSNGPIQVTAPSGFEVSINDVDWYNTINIAYTPPVLQNTSIYVRFSPTGNPDDYNGQIANSGGGAASFNVDVSGTSVLSYCSAGSNATSYEYIEYVDFHSISNGPSGRGVGGYQDFTSLSADIVQGQTYPFAVTLTNPYASDQLRIWVDWNQDGVFDHPDELVHESAVGIGPFTGNITIPTNSATGQTRMRIRVWDTAAEASGVSGGPCGIENWGEVEDYAVNVISGISCNDFEETTNAQICEGSTYSWRGNNYSVSGTYHDSLFTTNPPGCDSVYILNLTVNPVFEFVSNAEICEGDTYQWQGGNYTVGGTYTETYQTVNGCDSVYILNLTVNPVFEFVSNAEICEGDTYQWQGGNYTVGGTYTETYQTVNGCDSVYILNLTVNPVFEFVNNAEICEGDTYQWQGGNYTVGGTYTETYQTVNGCDSVYILNLTVNPVFEFVSNAEICEGDTYQWQGGNYTVGGTYTETYQTVNGCDSVYILNLTVNPVYEFVSNAEICEGDTYQWQGGNYTVGGTYTETYQTVNGCDSVYILNLTVNPVFEFVSNAEICEGDTYQWQGGNYTVGGTYTETYQTVNGCDSVYILNLTVNPVYEFVSNAEICEGDTYQWQGGNYTVGGTYTETYQTVNGCDSVYILNLTVNPCLNL
jgi:hypothetical protein